MLPEKHKFLTVTSIRISLAVFVSIVFFIGLPLIHYSKNVMANATRMLPPYPTEKNSFVSAAKIYAFPLRATNKARGASGTGYLRTAHSPFDVAVTATGKLIYDLEISVSGLLPASSLGLYKTYIAWITTPKLDRTEKLGTVGASGKLKATVFSMNKFILIITAEPSPEVKKRSGPILLRGISPSGLLETFQSHELFNNMPH
jgi:hypothetical protein